MRWTLKPSTAQLSTMRLTTCASSSGSGSRLRLESRDSAAIKPEAENRLVARLINPKQEDIDGFQLRNVPHGIKVVDFQPGTGRYHNYGGLWQSVELEYVSEIRVLDVFAAPRLSGGQVVAHVTLLNESKQARRGTVRIDVLETNHV